MRCSVVFVLILCLSAVCHVEMANETEITTEEGLEQFLQQLANRRRRPSRTTTTTVPSTAPSTTLSSTPTAAISLASTDETATDSSGLTEDTSSFMSIQIDMKTLLAKLLTMTMPKMTIKVPMNGIDVFLDETESDPSGYKPAETVPTGSPTPECPDNECLKICDRGYTFIHDENHCVIDCECIPWKCENISCSWEQTCPPGKFVKSNDMGCQKSCECETPSADCRNVTCERNCPYGYTAMRDSRGCLLHSCVCNVCPSLTCEPCERGFRHKVDSQGCQRSCECVNDPCDRFHEMVCGTKSCRYKAILLRDENGCYDKDCTCSIAPNILANYNPNGDGYMGSCPMCGKRELDDDATKRSMDKMMNLIKPVVADKRKETEEQLEKRLVDVLRSALTDSKP